jgi:hypothetical protein
MIEVEFNVSVELYSNFNLQVNSYSTIVPKINQMKVIEMDISMILLEYISDCIKKMVNK